MNGARKLLLFGGVLLASLGMLYGLHYAVLVEHQRLDHMGGALSTAFVEAAGRNPTGVHSALGDYSQAKYAYVREVDVHSHWIGLAMLLIVMGVLFDSVGFTQRVRFWIALTMLIGSVIFPLGVLLQIVEHGEMLPSALAIAGAALVTIALTVVAVGFARQRA